MGPSARKIVGAARPKSSSIFDLMEIVLPKGISSFQDMVIHSGKKLKLRLRQKEGPLLRGV